MNKLERYTLGVKHNFRDTLIVCRDRLGLYQRDMAKKLNVPYTTYRQWERGFCYPKEKRYHEIMKRLESLMKVGNGEYKNGN